MRIVLVCTGGPNYYWDASSLDAGIGGSEECLIRLAHEFAALGHDVTVFNNCARAGIIGDVHYVPVGIYAECAVTLDHADALISWRDWYPLLNRTTKARIHATHDIPVGCHHPCVEEMQRGHENALETIDRIVYLNNHHRNRSAWWPDEHSAVIPIGIDQSGLDASPARMHARCVYFSHPNRGLDNLRAIWPQVKAAHPHAELYSFWWEPEHFRPADEALGIKPMRRMNSRAINDFLLTCDTFTYPSVFDPEISPATTIRAQAAGVIPCVILKGGMVDTVQHGSLCAPGDYADSLIGLLCMSASEEWSQAREEMAQWARAKYSWPAVAAQYIELIKEIHAQKA